MNATYYQNINKIVYIVQIKKCAFQDCFNLDKVIIEKGLECIGGSTFDGCTNLSEIIYLGTVDEFKNQVTVQITAFMHSSVKKIVCVDGSIDVSF